MTKLQAKFTTAFSKDLKKKSLKRRWNLHELEHVIDLIVENSADSQAILKARHNIHKLSGKWNGSNECHVANAGDWLVVWRVEGKIAYLQRTGSHDDLFK